MSNTEVDAKTKLSVVLASQNARASVAECLRSIEKQIGENEIEIILADNSTDETPEIVSADFPNVVLVRAEKDKLIPELWGIGIGESAGDVIALTTTHFVPAENWIATILKRHENLEAAGVGGAIENDERAGIVSWAIYFCRYSGYMLPFTQVNAFDFAADNASYKRSALERVKHTMTDGFWETFVHQTMRKEKMLLLLAPEIIVYHRDSFDLSGFAIQRFRHGKQFGGARARRISNLKRIIYILLSPLIPLLYLYRISRRVFGKKRNVGKFLVSLPVLILFLVCWSSGEFYGYLRKSE